MLREALARIFAEYMAARAGGDAAFEGHPLARFIRNDARDAALSIAREASANPQLLFAKGSAGDVSRWTHTPWIAVMDQREAESVQEDVYVVYLFATDCADAYLTINQGCTTVYKQAPRPREQFARAELIKRADVMRARLPRMRRLSLSAIDLKETGWRSRLYEAGTIAAVRYRAESIPSEDDLRADLAEAILAYDHLIREGTYHPSDQMLLDAREEAQTATLVEAKRYRQHRKIERTPGIANKVKTVLGTVCMTCDIDMGATYGDIAEGYIEAHHLRPLSTYDDGATITLNAKSDFAVLCPNCHRVIHRMADNSDIEGLRAMVKRLRRS